MESDNAHKKRARNEENEAGNNTPSPSNKSPPHKRHTRSQSQSQRRKSGGKRKTLSLSQQSTTSTPVRDLVEEIIRAEEEEEKQAKEREDVFLTPDKASSSNEMSAEMDDIDQIESFQDMAKFFKIHMEKLPTKQDFDERVGGLEENVKKNSQKLNELEERLDRQAQETANRAQKEPLNPLVSGQSKQDAYIQRREEGRIQKFQLAKRSLRIWPIEGTGEFELGKSLDGFFRKALNMSESDLREVIIESITRTRTSPRARHYMEVLVVFREEDTRELILSYSRSLAAFKDNEGRPTAGLRMEVPDYLGSTFKLLETVSIYLKQKHGTEARRLIKYDDVELSLYIAFKPKGATSWRRITPKMAATYREKEDERTMMDFTWSPPPTTRSHSVLSQPNSLPIENGAATSSPRAPSSRTWVPPPPPRRGLL